MAIHLQITSGAKAGSSASFDAPVITLGRHQTSDVRFDPKADLDVSTHHAEIHAMDGHYVLTDASSRNGTFVNGERLGPGRGREVRTGDVIRFGPQGPTMSVRIEAGNAAAGPRDQRPGSAPADALAGAPNPSAVRPTTQRVADAVRQQTRGWRIGAVAAVVVLGGLTATGFWFNHRDAVSRAAEVQRLAAVNEQATRQFEARLQGMNDTSLTNDLRRRTDSLVASMRQSKDVREATVAKQQLERNHEIQNALVAMDLPAVREANNPAVVLIRTEISGHLFEATGFSVNPSGTVVTNRHVVSDSGVRASIIAVKFSDTREWFRGRVLRVSTDSDADLAVIQLDQTRRYPAVTALSASVDTPVGAPLVTLGFPLGTSTPMEGNGANFIAKTTLTTGTMSKLVTNLLQIDGFAGHGSSGSPVFDAHGHVIAVVWGGPVAGDGRIVYAVPAERINQILNAR